MARPSWDKGYNASICEKIPKYFADGASITEVATEHLGIARSTYYKWKEDHPEFRAACEFGENKAEVHNEKMVMQAGLGNIDNYSAPILIFMLKCRYRKTYGEQKEDKSFNETVLEQLLKGNIKIADNIPMEE